MKSLIGILCATLFLFSAPAKAEDLSGFYRWAEDVVVAAEMPPFARNGVKTVIIRVKNDWDNEAPHTFRFWIHTYVLCTKFAAEVEKAESEEDRSFESLVILADHNSKIRWHASGATSIDGKRFCERWFAQIDRRMRGIED